MSVNVLPPLFRYTNGSSLSVGTIRSRKPSLLMSPQIGLPHDFFASEIKPTWAVTSWNCWATATDERAVMNPTMVARRESAFLMPNRVPDKYRGPQSAALIRRQHVFITYLVSLGLDGATIGGPTKGQISPSRSALKRRVR